MQEQPEAARIAMREFLAELFGAGTEFPVFFCSLPNERDDPHQGGPRQLISRDFAEIENFVTDFARPGRGTFFCVGTIEGNRRSKEAVRETIGLHADVDFKNVLATEAEVWSAIDRLPCQPTVIVHSGHGLHLYWLFNEGLATQENLVRIELALRQVADIIAGDLSVAEVARLMRLPSSYNTKGAGWLQVAVKRTGGPRYELDDLEEWLTGSAPMLRRQPSQVLTPGTKLTDNATPDNPFLKAALAQGFKPPVDVEARLHAMEFGGPGDSSVHNTQLSVSASMLSAGIDEEEVVAVLLEATARAAGSFGDRWNWQKEERALRQMCATWLAKHPQKPEPLRLSAPARAAPAEDAPDNVTSLAEARAKRQPKPKPSKIMHVTVARAVLDVLAQRGERIMFSDKAAYRYADGLWTLETPRGLDAWLDRLIEEACEGMGLDTTARLINEARRWIIRQPSLYRREVPWDRHGQVPTLSGLVDPRTGEVTEAEDKHYATWRVPYGYDPEETCPLWLQMLEDVFADRGPVGRAAHIDLLQELLGLGLIDSKPKGLSRALVLYGVSDSGKSGLLTVLAGLFGPDSTSVPFEGLANTHGTMPFAYRLPWVLHEAFNQSQWHMSATVKAIISGDPIQINVKGGLILTSRFTAPIFWGTNHPAQFKEATKAITNRLAVVKCLRVFDPNHPVGVGVEAQRRGYREPSELVLATEMDGVLAWAVGGLKRALARGYLVLPEESAKAAEAILRESNLVAGFLEEATEYDPDTRLRVADFYAAWGSWWLENKGEERGLPSRDSMGRHLAARSDPRIAFERDNQRRYYVGVRLNQEGVRLWGNAIKSQSFQFKDRLTDASPADKLPNDKVPESWVTREGVRSVTAAHRAVTKAQAEASPLDEAPVTGIPTSNGHAEASYDAKSLIGRKKPIF